MWSGARVDDITPSPSQPRTALILPVEFHRRAVPYRLPQIPLVMRGVFYQGTRSHREFIRRFGYDLGRHTQSIYDSLLQARTVEAIDEHIFQFLALLDSGSFDLRRCVSQHSLATAISTIEKLERQGVFKDQLRRALASLSYASSSSESSGLVGLTHQHLLHIVPSTVLATVATFMDDEEFGIFADRYPHLLLHTEFRNRYVSLLLSLLTITAHHTSPSQAGVIDANIKLKQCVYILSTDLLPVYPTFHECIHPIYT